MIRLHFSVTFLTIFSVLTSCSGQTKGSHAVASNLVGGGCDGCDLMYIGMPENISSIDTSAGWIEEGQKLLVTGTVFKNDGYTPAPNVIIYYWQTDNNGLYSPKEGMDKDAKTHGKIRGWVKSDLHGRYSIYTIRPGPYPTQDTPAHIHISIKEPDMPNEYYIDDLVFDDDKLLRGKRNGLKNRGGSGILRVLISGDLQIAEHNIILGLNIPNYPANSKPTKQSGLNIGEDSPSFMPFHAFGPDKGTRTCPVCKYGRYHGVVYFVGNNPNWHEIERWLAFLEVESVKREKYLKVFFVYGNEKNYDKVARQNELEKIGQKLSLKNTALTFVPSLTDTESEADLNKINPSVENTFIIYRHRKIIAKFIDLKATTENFKLIASTLDKTKSEYFNLQEPRHD